MKINWGTGIVIAFIAFISFILYFVITATTHKGYDFDLVSDDYYKQELAYQQEINKENNAKSLKKNIKWKKTEEGLLIQFPEEIDYKKIKGKVFLYRPSNKRFDFETNISLSNHNLLIPKKRLLDGRWNITVDWEHQNKEYLFKDKIVY